MENNHFDERDIWSAPKPIEKLNPIKVIAVSIFYLIVLLLVDLAFIKLVMS